MSDGGSVPRTANVVIIGGGIIGLSIAFHLAERGATDVIVLDRKTIASGATSKGTGGIRQQFTTEANIRLSRESVDFYEQFEERIGRPLSFRQVGYLFLLATEAQHEVFARGVDLQNRLGVPSELICAEEINRRYPMIEIDGYIGGAFCPTDGYATPIDAAHAFASRIRELGVRIFEGVEVTGINYHHNRVVGVQTTARPISAPMIVNAAGPWASVLGRMIDLDLPVTVHPRQVFTLSSIPDLSEDFPFTVDMASNVYVHQASGSILLGGGDRDAPVNGPPVLDWSRFEGVAAAATRWLPALAKSEARRGRCGLREMTPDDHPILGPTPGIEGFWLAVGFSGHGFMHAPAVGRVLAEWMLTGQPVDLNTTEFALERFDGRALKSDAAVF